MRFCAISVSLGASLTRVRIIRPALIDPYPSARTPSRAVTIVKCCSYLSPCVSSFVFLAVGCLVFFLFILSFFFICFCFCFCFCLTFQITAFPFLFVLIDLVGLLIGWLVVAAFVFFCVCIDSSLNHFCSYLVRLKHLFFQQIRMSPECLRAYVNQENIQFTPHADVLYFASMCFYLFKLVSPLPFVVVVVIVVVVVVVVVVLTG